MSPRPTTHHRIWSFGADVDTDALAPGAWMQHGIEVVAGHCLETLEPRFAREVQRGDVLVAGANFGIGSSREQAAAALVHLGVAAVIAPSFGGLFFRNAFNLGLLLLTSPDTAALQGQSHLRLDLNGPHLQTEAGQPLAVEPVPDFLLHMVRAGGLMAVLRQRVVASSTSITS